MEQNEFQKALAKYHQRKQRQAQANLKELEGQQIQEPRHEKANPALPFVPVVEVQKKEKKAEQARPLPKRLEVTVTGPVDLKFEIEWWGTLLGGQMTKEGMKPLLVKQLTPLGRVIVK